MGGFSGFARSMTPAIYASGGHVYTKVHVKSILLDNDNMVRIYDVGIMDTYSQNNYIKSGTSTHGVRDGVDVTGLEGWT